EGHALLPGRTKPPGDSPFSKEYHHAPEPDPRGRCPRPPGRRRPAAALRRLVRRTDPSGQQDLADQTLGLAAASLGRGRPLRAGPPPGRRTGPGRRPPPDPAPPGNGRRPAVHGQPAPHATSAPRSASAARGDGPDPPPHGPHPARHDPLPR